MGAEREIRGVLNRAPGFDEAVLRRLEASYDSSRFPGWQDHCRLRAATALEAVELIITSQPDPALLSPRSPLDSRPAPTAVFASCGYRPKRLCREPPKMARAGY